jgi:hypothetical protein
MGSLGRLLTADGEQHDSYNNKLFPRASAASVANLDMLFSISIFSGVGLLLSLSVLILDKYTPGEWF